MIIVTRRHYLSMVAIFCFVAAFSLITASGLPSRIDYTQLGVLNGQSIAPELGALAPPVTLTDTDNQPVRFQPDQTGATVTLINFWATWCAPCEAEMPALQALHTRYHQRGLRVIGVNLGEPVAAIRPWADRLGLTFTLALDPDGRAAADYRLRGQPTTVIVGNDGRIRSIFYGATDLSTLERSIIPLLTEG